MSRRAYGDAPQRRAGGVLRESSRQLNLHVVNETEADTRVEADSAAARWLSRGTGLAAIDAIQSLDPSNERDWNCHELREANKEARPYS
ncbi:unnamed protein product [Trichogramma brassicae]|uniref:Uncharacterized protein n=1 Tax=Trichogramma brassicae TaxID=86971 RepID=A0A6H5IH48_9HYME|nr:unnamed protein product [Trichogramma brassicae]